MLKIYNGLYEEYGKPCSGIHIYAVKNEYFLQESNRRRVNLTRNICVTSKMLAHPGVLGDGKGVL